MLTKLHRAHGVTIHTGVTLTGITADGQLLVAHDDQGGRCAARTVLVAIGMAPRTALAEQACLDVRNGIVVDANRPTAFRSARALLDSHAAQAESVS